MKKLAVSLFLVLASIASVMAEEIARSATATGTYNVRPVNSFSNSFALQADANQATNYPVMEFDLSGITDEIASVKLELSYKFFPLPDPILEKYTQIKVGIANSSAGIIGNDYKMAASSMAWIELTRDEIDNIMDNGISVTLSDIEWGDKFLFVRIEAIAETGSGIIMFEPTSAKLIITTIPEPATFAAFFGVLALGIAVYRRRK